MVYTIYFCRSHQAMEREEILCLYRLRRIVLADTGGINSAGLHSVIRTEVNVADHSIPEDTFVTSIFRVRAIVAHVVPLLVVAQERPVAVRVVFLQEPGRRRSVRATVRCEGRGAGSLSFGPSFGR